MSTAFSSQTVGDLLDLFVAATTELKLRGITRSTNNPVADLSELLCQRGLHLTLALKSTKGYDATDTAGKKYEIKGRRLAQSNSSRELSAIRDIDGNNFDFLAGILFRENFTLLKACLIPIAVVKQCSSHVAHTNARKFVLRDEIWSVPGVEDITRQLSDAEKVVRGTLSLQ